MKRRYLDWAGWLLCGVSLLFVLNTGWTQRASFDTWQPDRFAFALLLGSMLVFLAGLYVLAGTWQALLRLYVREPGEPVLLRSVYARSNMGKYLPGNVAHLAARHMLGRAIGLGHGPLTLAALLDLAGLAVAALSVGVFAGVLNDHRLPALSPWLLASLILLVVAGYLAAPWLLTHFVSRFKPVAPLPRPGALPAMARVYLGYVAFFLLGGAALLLLSSQFIDVVVPGVAVKVLAVFGAAFFLGLVTPGAPSGLGVREAVIVLALDGLMPSAQAVLLALLFRLATVGADVLFVLLSMLERRFSVATVAQGDER